MTALEPGRNLNGDTMSENQAVSSNTTTKVVVATTVALSFISFWRASSIVLCDLASSSFYVGGIAEQAIGPAAPWFIIAVMFFAIAVRCVYLESSSMFVRGGVYVVVRDSMGPFVARLSVSALIFDYILTGPISAVSAGHYLGGLFDELFELAHIHVATSRNVFACVFALSVTFYFWWQNIKGIHESSAKALRIMQIMTVMVVVLLVWCPITVLLQEHVTLPPPPRLANLQFNSSSLGWLEGTFWPTIPAAAIIIAFGHSFLSLSGFETLAQVYREVASPKLKNLKIAANIICGYAIVSTGLITLFAGMIIPPELRKEYVDNLIGGLAMNLAGPEILRLSFHIFVVIVGTLILSGAVNTALIGANGIMNRIAEDGVLLDWFRKPHHRFGTTYRSINMIALLQVFTILLSRGDVYLLGEAYAFGVVWSFFLKSLGVFALRYQRTDQEYKTPLNFKIGGREFPFGLFVTTLALFLTAIANVFTKQIATIYGFGFTISLFIVFTISEHINRKKHAAMGKVLEEFNLEHSPEISSASMKARPGCSLVAVRDYQRLLPLTVALDRTNLRKHDIVVMTARTVGHASEYDLADEQLFTNYEQELFSKVVEMAEKQGKPVHLLVVPAIDPFDAMVQAASRLKAARLVTGVSASMSPDELARRIGLAWERLPEPRHPFALEIIKPDRGMLYVNLGPHPPRLWPEDIDRVHDLWLELSVQDGIGSKLHHRDVVAVALQRLETALEGQDRGQVVDAIKQRVSETRS